MPVISSAGGGSVFSAVVTLAHAQLLTLPTAWQVLVPGQGTGTLLVIHNAIGVTNITNENRYGNVSLDFPSSALYIAYDDDFAIATAQQDNEVMLGVSFDPPGVVATWPPVQAVLGTNPFSGLLTDTVNVAGAPLKLVCHNTGGDFTGGDATNTLTVTVYYSVVTV